MGRAPCCDKANVKKGPWSTEEDAKLKAYIEEHGTGGNWIALPQKIGLKRCGKSCRLRWLNYLRPNIKHGDFSEEEEHIICSLYISIGSRWSIIAAQLPGRTDNDIKNYWNTKLKKKLLGKRAPSRRARANQEPYMPSHGGANCGSNSSSSSSNTTAQALSASALERIQLHMRLQGLYSTFFSNHGSSPWPKHDTDHKLLPSQQTDAVATTVVQQPQHLGQSQCLATVAEAERVSSARASYTQQESFERSGLGFSCPVGAPVVDMPSSSSDVGGYSYTGFGLHDELYDLMYCKSGVAAAAGAPHDGIPLPELHCSNGGGALTWATCDYGAALQDSSVLQDYVLGGYDA